MSYEKEKSPVGHKIENLDVIGKESNPLGQWVGSDVLVQVPTVGRFFLRVVTKKHFISEKIEEFLDYSDTDVDIEALRAFKLGETETEKKLPFVMNDDEITESVLKTKFHGRIVEEDLAKSMWYHDES